MADGQTGWRGKPLVALCLIVAAWGGTRVTMLSAVSPSPEGLASARGLQVGAMPVEVPDRRQVIRSVLAVAEKRRGRTVSARLSHSDLNETDVRIPQRETDGQMLIAPRLLRQSNPALAPHQSLTRRMRVPREAEVLSPPSPAPVKDDPRWSGDNWLLMRAGSGAAAQAPGAASYGASQAGAVVRYRLGRGDLHESYGYLRTSLAINAPGKDKEVALGFGFRPVSRLPLRVLAEARLQDTKGSAMQVRPVATVVTELMPQRLPLGLTAEAYGQAGYAGGRGATAFYDVQAVVERALPRIGGRNRDLRLGAGVWSGGQEGAVRLDVGPRASFRLDLGDASPARVAVDWRFRVAGNARPGSGPALTVASSF
ncbi:hypothetical protein HGI47_16190 [Novosphingobium sp. ERN07]|uniref:hypothetical protein n=1 Tax=Novosphingobium sp. ERN07 TaxID=2726187 RepID=UPI0014571153|nr:hypothetical protein [Novosphingobium sp. ERN07]NLR72415.1 hypothetical protein [Novosphingobium sp. ERN07]